MNKEQFDKIFEECEKEFTTFTEEQILEKLKLYQSEEDNISSMHMAIFAYLESIATSKDLLYSVLSKVLDIKE